MSDEGKCYSDIKRTEENRMTQMLTIGIEKEDWDVQEKEGDGTCRPNDFLTLIHEEEKEMH
jgi:hypothetical protein